MEPPLVPAKEYITPKFSSEWLEPCDKPKIPVGGPQTTQEELLIFVTSLIETVDCQVAKQKAVKETYQSFIGNLPKGDKPKNP